MHVLCYMADCQGVLQNIDIQVGLIHNILEQLVSQEERQEVSWQVAIQLRSSPPGSRGCSEGEIVWLPASLMPVIPATSA